MKYLGVILDQTLSFTNHADYIRNKAASLLRMLGQMRCLVNHETSLNLYKTLMCPLFEYAAPVYDCLSKQDSYKLQKVQNCALRIVTKSDRRTHIADLHNALNMLYLVDKHHISTLCHTYKCLNNLAPETNCNQIEMLSETHDRQTRYTTSSSLYIPNF